MTIEEHNLLEYMNQQFPATVGHLPLLEKIHAVWQSGMTSATQIMRHEINTCHGDSVGCQPCVARENSIVDIEQARDAVELPAAQGSAKWVWCSNISFQNINSRPATCENLGCGKVAVHIVEDINSLSWACATCAPLIPNGTITFTVFSRR